ncbi:UDP-glucose 4-epimerase [ANME-1 cluster archaeon GoMg3.2]|nr:UDP-glucose 4-epimerase [ANME-1 cluster archaeon GoMg3.2]
MKILITGGAGFIGSHLAEKLAYKHEVIVLDNLDSYYDVRIKKENVKIIESKGAKFIIGDITNYDFIEKIIKENNIEIIFHEAARPGVRYSIKDPFLPNKVNVIGTLNILKASLDSDVKKVINASSSSVYGKVEYLPFDENQPTLPISPYAVSKLAAEHYCRVFHEVYGLKTISLRYFTVYGTRMRPDLAVPIFTKSILNNELPIIFGNGEQTRDFTYIDDIVDANVKLLKTNRADGEVLNTGSGRRVTINYMIDTLKNLLNSDIKSKYVDPIKGDARDTLANIDKAKKLIGYEPKTSLEEGLRKFIGWYKKNPGFYG